MRDETPTCPNHGPMVKRKNLTAIDAWCGTWRDCEHRSYSGILCRTVLDPSEELLDQEAEMRNEAPMLPLAPGGDDDH